MKPTKNDVNPYTVLLALPDYIAKGPTPWHNIGLTFVVASNPASAIAQARMQIADRYPENEVQNMSDFAVLFVCSGHQYDLTPDNEN